MFLMISQGRSRCYFGQQVNVTKSDPLPSIFATTYLCEWKTPVDAAKVWTNKFPLFDFLAIVGIWKYGRR